MTDCVTDADLHRFHAGELAEAEEARVREHLAECERCAQRDADLVAQHEEMLDRVKGMKLPETAERPPHRPAGEQAGRDAGAGQPPGPSPGVEIEGYKIVREVHRGGQGVVYQAVQTSTKRKVAIKVLLEGPYASPSARRRFEREIELVASLKHPNIISIFHSGQTPDGRQFCVMDYVRGVPLSQYVRDKKLTLEQALKLFGTVCDAVNYAHQKGVIHRDLKPSNILVDSEGVPRVLDFGLAKTVGGPEQTLISITGQVVGTLPYMSPEQARGNPDEIDIRTDVYALGVILYELLTGQYPYPVVGQMAEVLKHIEETQPTAPTKQWKSESGIAKRSDKLLRPGKCPIDENVETIILKTLSKERERRYQSAGELSRDIAQYLAGEPIQARPPSMVFLLRRWFRQNARAAFWTVAIGVICAGLGAVASGLAAVPVVMGRFADVYADFPSLEPPLLAMNLAVPWWLRAGLAAVAVVALVGMGLFQVLLVRPKTRSADFIGGATTGLVAGVTMFATVIGWAIVLTFTVADSITDMGILANVGRHATTQPAVTTTQPFDIKLWKYTDLAEVAPEERARTLMRKIVTDQAAAIPIGIWVGMLGSLVTCGVLAICQAMTAGALLRRGGRLRSIIGYYLEVTIPFCCFIIALIPLALGGGLPGNILFLALSALLVVLAVIGVTLHWNWRLRYGLYAACLIPMGALIVA